MDCIVLGVTESDTTERLLLHFILYLAPVGKSQVCFLSAWCSAYQALPSMGFSRQEYWSGLPLPSPGDLPNPGIEHRSPAL